MDIVGAIQTMAQDVQNTAVMIEGLADSVCSGCQPDPRGQP
ncbi:MULTISPECIES: hypothetical protein [unclassified Pseudomonas]